MKFNDLLLMDGCKLLQFGDQNIGWILLGTDGKIIAKLWKSEIQVVCDSESQALKILKTVAFAVQMGYRVSKLEFDLETTMIDMSVVLPCPIEYIDVNVSVG